MVFTTTFGIAFGFLFSALTGLPYDSPAIATFSVPRAATDNENSDRFTTLVTSTGEQDQEDYPFLSVSVLDPRMSGASASDITAYSILDAEIRARVQPPEYQEPTPADPPISARPLDSAADHPIARDVEPSEQSYSSEHRSDWPRDYRDSPQDSEHYRRFRDDDFDHRTRDEFGRSRDIDFLEQFSWESRRIGFDETFCLDDSAPYIPSPERCSFDGYPAAFYPVASPPVMMSHCCPCPGPQPRGGIFNRRGLLLRR